MPMSTSTQIASKIIEIGERIYSQGLIAGTDGNISARLDSDRFFITPSGVCKGRMKPDDLIIIDHEGNHLEGKGRASSEMSMHLRLYRERRDIKACVHTHPPYATAFSVAGISLDEKVLPEVLLFVGGIPLAEYASPGTEEVGESLAPLAADNDAFLLRNHGLVTIGKDLEEAANRTETVEHFARILYLARQLGNVEQLGKKEIAYMESLRQKIKRNGL